MKNDAHVARLINEKRREMDLDYIEHIRSIGNNQAVSRRFFAIFEFENGTIAYNPSELDIQFALESAVRNFKSYLSRCGNAIEEFTDPKVDQDHPESGAP